MYRKMTAAAPNHEDTGTRFIRIINNVRAQICPQPDMLLVSAQQLDELADTYRRLHNSANSPLLEKILGQAQSFKERAEILQRQTQ